MQTRPKTGAAHCHAVEAWLRGEVAPPKRGETIIETLRFLCVERLGTLQRHARELLLIGEVQDVSVAWAWHAACAIASDCMNAPPKRARAAEQTAYVQMQALYERCWEKIDALQASGAFWYTEDLGSNELSDVLAEWKLLAGLLALSLWECGDAKARDDVQAFATEYLQDNRDGESYAPLLRVIVGMAKTTDESWRPGQGARGALASAIDYGQSLLVGAVPDILRADTENAKGARALLAAARLRDVQAEADKRPPREPEPAPIPDGPSLLVLSSVDHLPGSAETGKDKPGSQVSSTARGEWAPYAGRHWPLVLVPDLAAARAELVAEFPYAADVVDAVLGDLVGRPHLFIRPLLLVGGPGSGKTRLARRLAEVLGLGLQIYGCAGQADGAFVGTSRQWSTGRASVPLQLLKRLGAASAVLMLDEIEKASTRRDNGCILDALLPFLTDDAARVFDPFLEIATDLSGVSYIATANSLTGLRASHPALVDRFRVYGMPAPRTEDLPTVCRTILADLRVERGLGPEWLPDLSPDELDLVAEHYDGGSLRVVRRLAETIVAGREVLAVRN